MKKFIRFPEVLDDLNQLKLRKVKEDDKEFLFNLKKKTLRPYIKKTWGWDEDWQLEYFNDHYEPENLKIIQFLQEDIGCISIVEKNESIDIALIEVLPEYQNRGIGTFLIKNSIRELRMKKKPITLQVLKSNKDALRLYQQLGFTIQAKTSTHYKLRIH
ncbi:MAG: Ribosomal-protein-alanine N-acetyltransferase [Promethearchaeota archaeon]|nr:MAG: Ribosomal-protein-alanine N-acetyltransferase [Candidatus Lokiarchaeota archaeon]